MPWISFTAAVIRSRCSQRELQVFQETADKEYGEEGGEAALPEDNDPAARLDAVAAQVLARFRGAILANPGLTHIGPAGTLPEFCHDQAAVYGRWAMIGLPPVPEGTTDPRLLEYKAAVDFLKELSKMSPAVFAEAETPAAAAGGAPSYGGKPLLDF